MRDIDHIELKRLWDLGLSMGAIAPKLGLPTRNAVAGAIHRARKAGVVLERRTTGNPPKPKPPKPQRLLKVRAVPPRPPTLPLREEPKPFTKPVSLREHTDQHCKAVVGDQLWCGELRVGKGPYCATHAEGQSAPLQRRVAGYNPRKW